MKPELINYLQQQIRTADERLRRFTQSPVGGKYPCRFMFAKIKRYIDGYLNKTATAKMVLIPGFRGVGKTTMMAQVCESYKNQGNEVLFLSVEDARNLFGVGIAELMAAYEEISGINMESVKKPLLVFLDEIQADPKWAITLKSLYEKTANIFFCGTGSSAVILQTTTNLARRAIFEKMPPMCFSEYEMVKNNIFPPRLKENIRQAVYFSKNAAEAYGKLLDIKTQVNQYWAKINRADIKKYLAHGTLPFAMMMPNDGAVYDSISLLLDKIIKFDLSTLNSFNMETMGSVKRILFVVAENDTTSLNSLEKRFGINRLTISNIFEALEKAEVLIKVPAYGSNMTAAKKPNKYLFMSPAIRMSFFYFTGQENTYLTRQGKLLEDSIGSHLYREFILCGQGAIRYDSAQGGADFVLQILNKKQIIIEAGMGEKHRGQIINSAKKIRSDYNLIYSNSELRIDNDFNILFVPLDYYFLM